MELHECRTEGLRATWQLKSAPFDTFGVLFGTSRVPNCIEPHHDAHAMVGQLLMVSQCALHVFVIFEKHLFRL